MRYGLTDLRLFLAVVEAGSITHGAEAVGLSLPAASERLRAMEASGGVRLLTRLRHGVAPTGAGETLAHHARLLHRQLAHMQGELAEHANGLRRTVRLMANTAAITEFLPARLGRWMAANPHADVALEERQSVETVAALAAGLAEIGIVSDTVGTAGLSLRPFAVDRLVVAMRADHPLARRTRLRFADVLDEAFVGLQEGALQDNLDGRVAIAGGQLRTRVRTRTFEGICRMAAEGVGLGIVPETAARRCRRAVPLAAVRLRDDWATRRLSICVRSGETLAPSARSLAEHLSMPSRTDATRLPRESDTAAAFLGGVGVPMLDAGPPPLLQDGEPKPGHALL